MENYQHLMDVSGKTALITGGTGGLGGAIAEALLQNGANIVVTGRDLQKAEWLKQEAMELGRDFLALQVDITDEAQVQEMVALLETQFGTVDILVNSAGMNILKKAEEYDGESWDKVFDLNVKGLHLVTSHIGKLMIAQHYGKIINLSSAKSFLGVEQDYTAYCASKGAVNAYTRQIACEWAKYGIYCNAISPTFVRTAINAHQLDDPEFYSTLTKRIPLGRIGTLKDIGAAALFLASSASDFVTGQVLCVDGGLTAKQ